MLMESDLATRGEPSRPSSAFSGVFREGFIEEVTVEPHFEG